MAVFKCKMCGGVLDVGEGLTVCECEYCGSKQTVPAGNDEKIAKLFERANRLRFNNEFDKAYSVYETIIGEDPEAAEAYWGLVLCKYGVEYVDDPATFDKVPTCHRSSFESVMDDENFEQVMETADTAARVVYREQAKQIEDIRKGIIEVSGKEKPYDIFICYKETAEDGQRTIDSVLAQDVYDALTNKGYRVFFSRITLEDKLGTEYEPYIFAALNSAKVMLAFGTSYDNYNAVWVKNEWQRYLKLMEKDKEKHLIPCYKDIDAYDMPKEFARLQAQDMGKVGATQDLLRGIEKLIGAQGAAADESESDDANTTASKTVTNAVPQQATSPNVTSLLERAFMFLEDGNWKEANEYCERVLDIDPKCAEAYLGKLMAELKVRKRENFKDCHEPIGNNVNFGKAMRFGNEELQDALKNYERQVLDRIRNDWLQGIYDKAMWLYNNSKTEESYKNAAKAFEQCIQFGDAELKRKTCLEKAEGCRKNKIYDEAINYMCCNNLSDKETAVRYFQSISGWRDVDEKIKSCKKDIAVLIAEEREQASKLEEIKVAKEKRKAKIIRKIKIVIPIICACLALILITTKVVIPPVRYGNAIKLMEEGNYVEAYQKLRQLDGYKDSTAKMQVIYNDYMDDTDKLLTADVNDIIKFGSYEQDNNKDNGTEDIEWRVLDKSGNKILVLSEYAIECKPYNNETTEVTWVDCDIRQWLNNEFINQAFDSDEKKRIITTEIENEDNPEYGTEGGIDTNDQIFLLSIEEVEKYFSSNNDRKCMLTQYVKAQGGYSDKVETCRWMLRTPGCSQCEISYIGVNSLIYTSGRNVAIENNPVRPAMWISIE